MRAEGLAEGPQGALRTWVEGLRPASLAAVMATGIVTLAAEGAALTWPGRVGWVFSLVAYGVLGVATVSRVLWVPRRVWSDLGAADRAPGFLTWVAATGVVGMLVLRSSLASSGVAEVVWSAQLALGLIVVVGLLVRARWRRRAQGAVAAVVVSPWSWLLVPVAFQSVAILTANLELHDVGLGADPRPWRGRVAVGAFVVGAVAYVVTVIVVTVIWHVRATRPREVDPAAFIAMGGAAISSVASMALARAALSWPESSAWAPNFGVVAGLAWIVATAWLPVLVGSFVFAHFVRRAPRLPPPRYWAMVFPLGMYAVATQGVARLAGADAFLDPWASSATLVALGAWSFVFLANARTVAVRVGAGRGRGGQRVG